MFYFLENKRRKVSQIISSSDEERDTESTISSSTNRQYTTPAQDLLKAKINLQEKELAAAIEGRDSGLAGLDIQNKIDQLKKDLETNKKKLSSKQNQAKLSKKYRMERKQALSILKNENPDTAKALHFREAPGRPRIEDDQPELLKAIIDIAMFGGAADSRRRTELIRSCKTLKDLHCELEAQGFTISRSGTYLRLLPRDSRTAEGKKHIMTVPVKLCRAQADMKKTHSDGKFCTASIR